MRAPRRALAGTERPVGLLHASRCTHALPLTPPHARASCRVCLAHGTDVNARDEEGWRPLHHAAHTGSHRVLALLLSTSGVDVNAPSDNTRWRPIDVCGTADAARMLLDAGAVQSSAAPGSLSALHHAAYQARLDVVEVLLARGARVSHTFSADAGVASFASCDFGGSALHLAAASLGCALVTRDALGDSFDALAPDMAHAQAAATRRAAVCEALLRAGADVHGLTGESGFRMTPLFVASHVGDAAVIRVLLRAGARVDVVEAGTGWSALHFAAHGGHTDAIHALAAGGADVNVSARSDRLLTPLMCAVMGSHHGVVRALLERGADSSEVARVLDRPPATLLPRVMDDATRALVARHLRGVVAPARACALPDCEARRRASYDDKKLMMCPCKVRPGAAAAAAHAASEHSAESGALPCVIGGAQLAFYCCKEHQVLDRKRHKAACKAACSAAQASS